MARKKDSKALFEVLSKTETTMNVPDWMKAKPADVAAAGPSEAEDETLSPPVPVQGEPAQDETPPEAEEEVTEPSEEDEIDDEVEAPPEVNETTEDEESQDEESDVEAAAEADDDEEEDSDQDAETQPEPRKKRRFDVLPPAETTTARFSMNPKMIVILIGVAGVLLLLAFALGRLTADRAGSASKPPSTPANGAELRSLMDNDAPETCASGRRDPDRYFLIIETLRGNGDADKTEAERIIRFCKAQGLPADMVEMQVGDQPRVAVWCLLGFRFANSEQALEHARKVEDVGQEYFKKYKTYKFLQRRRKDGSLRPFFVSGKVEQAGG